MLIGTVYCLTGSDIMQIIIDIIVATDHVVVYTKCIFHYSNALHLKVSEQQGALVHFLLHVVREKHKNVIFGNKMCGFSCTNVQSILESI